MKVKVRFYAPYRQIAGAGQAEVDLAQDARVEDLLCKLFEKYGQNLQNLLVDGKTGALAKYVKVLKNGRDIDFLQGVSTKLTEGDLIVIFPPVAGGSIEGS